MVVIALQARLLSKINILQIRCPLDCIPLNRIDIQSQKLDRNKCVLKTEHRYAQLFTARINATPSEVAYRDARYRIF